MATVPNKHSTDIMAEEDAGEKTGVYINKCDFEGDLLVCQPTVAVDLVDSHSGVSLVPSGVQPSTQPFNAFQKRSQTPCWDEMLVCHDKFSDITEKKSNPLFLFELCDVVEPPSSMFQKRRKDPVKVRVAWAFLKPIGSDGSLNVNKDVRLQLFKVRKQCSISHQTCPLFHLYSDHKKKKFAGSLYLKVQGTTPTTAEESITPRGQTERRDSAAAAPVDSTPVVPQLITWSRLPTQSCKVPNTKVADLSVGKRGATCLCFCHSGLFLACGTFAALVIFDVLKKKTSSKLVGHSGLLYEVSWSFDDSLLVSVSADCSAVIWSMQPISKSPLYVLPHPSFVYCGKWFQKQYSLITGGKDGIVRYWGRSENGFDLVEELKGHEGFVSALETHGDSALFSGDSRGFIWVWSLEDGAWNPVRKLALREVMGAAVDAIHLHPGRRRMVVTPRMRDPVAVDLGTGVTVVTFKAAQPSARSVSCLTPCGELLISVSQGNVVDVWQFHTGKLVATYHQIFSNLGDTHSQLSACIGFHPFEHMAAFALLGSHCPVVLLQYDNSKEGVNSLGLVSHEQSVSKPEANPRILPYDPVKPAGFSAITDSEQSTEEKLAAIVRKIDRVFKAKKEMISHLSSQDDSFANQ